MSTRFPMTRLALVLATATAAGWGCAKAQAVEAPRAPLVVPEAPPRTLAPAEPELQPAPDPAPPETQPEPARSPARRTTPRGNNSTAPREREDGQKENATKPEEPVKAQPSDPGPRLTTPQTADDGEVERRVNQRLQRASRALSSVDYGRLGRDARTQYDTAKRFIQQAQEALKSRNYVYALYLADKADTLALGLGGR